MSVQPAIDTAETRARDQDLIALVQRVATGDQSALAALYDTTNRLVYGLVLRVLGDMSSAEEVLLDVYTQVWRQASSYDSSRGAPLAWLTTIARSRAIDRLRSGWQDQRDRKSTRLNSSHLGISYAVFCLKKKNKNNKYIRN